MFVCAVSSASKSVQSVQDHPMPCNTASSFNADDRGGSSAARRMQRTQAEAGYANDTQQKMLRLVPDPIMGLAIPSIALPPSQSARGEERKVDGCGGECQPCALLDTCRPCCLRGAPLGCPEVGWRVGECHSKCSLSPQPDPHDGQGGVSEVAAKPLQAGLCWLKFESWLPTSLRLALLRRIQESVCSKPQGRAIAKDQDNRLLSLARVHIFKKERQMQRESG